MSNLKDLKDMSTAERNEAVLDFGRKIDGTVGEKVRSAKGWLLKIAGGFLLFIGAIVLLFGAMNVGLVIFGVGVALFGSGLRNISARARHAMLGLGLVIVGAAILNYGLGQITQAKKSAGWPFVTGTVIKSEKEKHTTTEDTKSNKKNVTYYLAMITYEYQIDGNTHTSDRVAFGGRDRNQTVEYLNKYPAGKSVAVYYDPDRPEEAVLEKGLKKKSYTIPIVGAVFIILGLLIGFKGNSKRR